MKRKVALQLYSVREDCARDLEGTLKAVREMGYIGVEFAGYHGRDAKELRKMLDDLGLQVSGTHIQLETLLGDELGRTVEFNHELGNRYLIVPAVSEEWRRTKEDWRKLAELFNEISERVKPDGMFVGYHNHMVEFQRIDGELPWDIFFSTANQDVVMQLDVGNAMRGGAKVEELFEVIRRYPGRAKSIHVKEFSATNPDAIVGEGEVDWVKMFELCEGVGGTEWFIVEQESYAYAPIECVRLCLEKLKGMGLV